MSPRPRFIKFHRPVTDRRNAKMVKGLYCKPHAYQHVSTLQKRRALPPLKKSAGDAAAASAIHDFRNLMGALSGQLELLAAEVKPEHPGFSLLSAARGTCAKALSVAASYLSAARGEPAPKSATAIPPLINDAVETHLRGSPIVRTLDIPKNLWSAVIDPVAIGRVLGNLIVNARQAMGSDGGISCRAGNLTVEAESKLPLKPGRYVMVAIRDTGPGIPAYVAQRLFQTAITTKPTGNGLGLSGSMVIVHEHGGHIEFDTRTEGTDHGTEFRIYLPAGPEPVTPVVTAPPPAGSRILVLDDDERLRTLVVSMLKHLNYEAEAVATGEEAVACFQRNLSTNPFRALLLDLNIERDISGAEVMRRILALDPSARAILSTGGGVGDFRALGFRGALPKPFTMAALETALQATLNADN